MAKHKKQVEGKETVEFFQELDRETLKTEKFLERNSKLIIGIFILILGGILGYFAYQQFVITPKNEEALKAKAIDLLKIFDLDRDADTLAKNLAYGQQRRLEIVRALATEPKILFLDEPAAGMNPQETAELTDLIRRIKEEFKITIMLIEHDMNLVMDVTERIYVLEYGRLIAHGTPSEIKTNKRVIEAYLGGEA